MDQIASDGERNDFTAIAAKLLGARAPDIVEALNELEADEAANVLLALPFDLAIDVLDQPGMEHEADVLVALPRERATPLLVGMAADRAADLFRQLAEPVRSDLLRCLSADARSTVEKLLTYPEESAGSIMTTEFVSVPSNWTAGQTLEHVRKVERSRETVYSIFVVDPRTKVFVMAVPLRRLISLDPQAMVLDASPARKPISVEALDSRDTAARLISRYDLLAVPVIDAKGHVIGIVTVDDVLDAMIQRQTEQVQRFGGMEPLGEPYLRIGFANMIKKRGGWLAILFLSEMLTATAMQGFQDELEKAIVLTMFIPLIMSSGGNSGSQATSLLIRALALREVDLKDWWRVALRELPTGLTLGALLGLIGVVRIAGWQWLGFFDYGPHWQLVALTVFTALIGIVAFGSMMGSMLPFVLRRLGFDPASASAPFVATLVDVSGLVIYFGVAAVILRGTLL